MFDGIVIPLTFEERQDIERALDRVMWTVTCSQCAGSYCGRCGGRGTVRALNPTAAEIDRKLSLATDSLTLTYDERRFFEQHICGNFSFPSPRIVDLLLRPERRAA